MKKVGPIMYKEYKFDFVVDFLVFSLASFNVIFYADLKFITSNIPLNSSI